MTSEIFLSIIAALLLGLSVYAIRSATLYGALIVLQCGFFFVSYVVRPGLLLWVKPRPRYGDPIADPRLASLGYEDALQSVLRLVLVGIVVYCAGSAAILRFGRWKTYAKLPDVLTNRIGIALLAVGWASRIASLANDSGLLATLATLGSVGAGVLLLRNVQAKLTPSNVAFLGAVLVSESVWSFQTTSKAPIFACGLWIAILALSSHRPRGRSVAAVAAVGVGLLLIFPVLQGTKIANGSFAEVPGSTAAYPPVLQLALPVIRRLDLVSSATDAALSGPGTWLKPLEAMERAVLALVPSQLQYSKPSNSGAIWAVEVRSHSLQGSSNTGVHLAEGTIAEGYVIAGNVGIVVEMLCLIFASAAAVRWLTGRNRALVVLALFLLSQPYLFERGALGIFEGFGKGLEVMLVSIPLLAAESRTMKYGVTRFRSTIHRIPGQGSWGPAGRGGGPGR